MKNIKKEIWIKPFSFYGDFRGKRKWVKVHKVTWNRRSLILWTQIVDNGFVPVWEFHLVQSLSDVKELFKIYSIKIKKSKIKKEG